MATQDFTPTGDSPRTADDSDGIKGAITAALAAQSEGAGKTEDVVDQPGSKVDDVQKQPEPTGDDDKKPDPKGDAPDGDKKLEVETKKPEAEGDKSAEPPSSWSAKDKETFKTLDKPGQEFLLERHRSMEADYTRKTQALAERGKEYDAIDQIFAPHIDRMKQANVTRAALIQGWERMERTLQSGNFAAQAELIAGAAKNYRIDPIQLATQILVAGGVADPKAAMEQIAANASEQIKAQPQPIQLPAEVTQRLAKIDQVAGHFENQQRAAAEAEVVRINSDLDKFKTATDDKGALLHPHFDELVDTMSQIVDRATTAKQPVPPIDQLYQDAIFANPAVRQKWLDAKLAAERSSTEAAQQVAREKAAAEARAKSEKARKAGSSVTGSAGSGQPLNGRGAGATGNLRSTIAAAVEDQDQVVH